MQFDERRQFPKTPGGNPAPEYVLEYLDYVDRVLAPQWAELRTALEAGEDVAEQVAELADEYGLVQHEYWKGLRDENGEKLNVLTISPPIGLG
jgi:hypothetical protein